MKKKGREIEIKQEEKKRNKARRKKESKKKRKKALFPRSSIHVNEYLKGKKNWNVTQSRINKQFKFE